MGTSAGGFSLPSLFRKYCRGPLPLALRVVFATGLVVSSLPLLMLLPPGAPVAPSHGVAAQGPDEHLWDPPASALDRVSAAAPAAVTEILVKFKASANPAEIDGLNRSAGTTIHSVNRVTGIHTLTLPEGADVGSLLQRYQSAPIVEWAEANEWHSLSGPVQAAALVPNDSFYAPNQKQGGPCVF